MSELIDSATVPAGANVGEATLVSDAANGFRLNRRTLITPTITTARAGNFTGTFPAGVQ
jgi:hypothetical protein